MHIFIYGMLCLILFILIMYIVIIGLILSGRHRNRRHCRLMFREQYVEAKYQREQKERDLGQTDGWKRFELYEYLVREVDALEKYLVHRGKKSWELEIEGRLLITMMDDLATH